MSILVSGSVAIDVIMRFDGRFSDVPNHGDGTITVFPVSHHETTFGGTGGNIAFNLSLLGEAPLLLATAGHDFADYGRRLDQRGISRSVLRVCEAVPTCRCIMTEDRTGARMAMLYRGALALAHEARVEDVAAPIGVAIVAPSTKRAMLEHVHALARRSVPYLADPGPELPTFARDELLALIRGAAAYVVNEGEWHLTERLTGLGEASLLELVDTIVVTRGARGSVLLRRGERVEVAAVPAPRVVDATGCGDAYRAGLLYAMQHGHELLTGAQLGSLLGALNIAELGPQRVDLDPPAIREQFRRAFGKPLPLP